MGRPRTGLIAVAALVAMLLGASAAQAAVLSAPDVFLREMDESNQPVGDWMPLGTTMHSVNRYEIGVGIQDTGQPGNTQRVLVQVNAAPDGQPQNQPDIFSLCLRVSGTAGQIADTTEDLRYAGDGTYSLTVTVTPNLAGDEVHGCTAGPATTGSFTAAADTSVRFIGHMIIVDPDPHHRFGGLQITPALGAGGTEIRCARDPRPAPDGTLTGSLIVNQGGDGAQNSPSTIDAGGMFEKPGLYACVARSVAGGKVPGPWSAPTAPGVVQMGFYRRVGGLRLPDFRGPRYTLTERFIPPEAIGGVVSFSIRSRGRPATARARQIKARIGRGGVATLHLRLPPVGAFSAPKQYVATVSFAGTRFAAARSSFPAFAVDVLPASGGRSALQFSPPCLAHHC